MLHACRYQHNERVRFLDVFLLIPFKSAKRAYWLGIRLKLETANVVLMLLFITYLCEILA